MTLIFKTGRQASMGTLSTNFPWPLNFAKPSKFQALIAKNEIFSLNSSSKSCFFSDSYTADQGIIW